MDMLQTVIRASIESASMAGPRYSTTYPWPPPVPICAISASTRSLAVTPSGRLPLTVTAIVFGRACGSVWVASTCSTSDWCRCRRPARRTRRGWRCGSRRRRSSCPAGSGPAAGRRRARCPGRGRRAGAAGRRTPSQLRRSVSTWVRLTGSAIGLSQSSVGTLWSSVAMVRSGRRTVPAGEPQAVEGLRAGHLVEQVEVDVEQVGLAVGAADDVLVPDLLGQGPAHGLLLRARSARSGSRIQLAVP